MMGRTLEIEFYDYNYLVSADGAGQHDGITPADAEMQGWFPHFIEYKEDASGRLLFLDQPQCSRVLGLVHDIAWMRAHPRPHFGEVFDQVELREEWPAAEFHTIKTLHHVTLLEALEELVKTLEARDAKIRARDQAER